MKSGFVGGLLTGFTLAILGGGWFVAAHKVVDTVQARHDVPLPAPAYAPDPNNKNCTPVYFATSVDGRIIPLTPLNEPHVTESALVSWAAQTLTKALTFGFNGGPQQMQKSAVDFSTAGWQEFHNALAARGLGVRTIEQGEVFTSTPARAPKIRQHGVKDGRYVWILELDMIGTTSTAQNPKGTSAPYSVQIVVARSPDTTKPAGIDITSFRFRDTP